MHRLPAVLTPLAALAMASSSGPEEAGYPPFVPRVSVERAVFRLSGKAFVVTTVTRTFPLVFNWDVEALDRRQTASSETVRVTQIANPETESDRRWNAVVRARIGPLLRQAYIGASESGAATPARQTSVEVGIEPVAVAPGIIAARVDEYIYPHDMMKGWGTSTSFIWSEKDRRALTAEDLFDPGTGWWRALTPAMLEIAYGEPVPQGVKGYEALERNQTPMIGEDGLCLKFKEADSGAFVLAQPLCLPWKTLRPYLRKDLPFEILRLEERAPDCDGCES